MMIVTYSDMTPKNWRYGYGIKFSATHEAAWKGSSSSIFLAGPSPRSHDVKSWRPEAIDILEELKFEGEVFVPELSFRLRDKAEFDYLNQVNWEFLTLNKATAIAFWVPRKINEGMPAFTTNVEFGYWMAKKASKVFYGRPDNSDKNSYLDWTYTNVNELEFAFHKKIHNNLKDVLIEAVEYCKQSENSNQERII